jgi:hypothetical protein
MPTSTTKSESSTKSSRIAQDSPLLSLPPEIRLSIYTFAFQDTVNEIRQTPSHAGSSLKSPRPAMQGSLALLHTSSLLRTESSDALNSLLRLENFQVRRMLAWEELIMMAKAGVDDDSEWREIDGMVGPMRDVHMFINWVHGHVQGS